MATTKKSKKIAPDTVVVSTPLNSQKGEIRTEFVVGRYESRVALTGTVDYGEMADEVLRVQKILKPEHQPLGEVRNHLAHCFRLYGSGAVEGVFMVVWKRVATNLPDAQVKGVSHDLLVTVRRSW